MSQVTSVEGDEQEEREVGLRNNEAGEQERAERGEDG